MKLFNQKKLAIFLIGVGALPFIICALLIGLQLEPEFLPASPMLIMHSYAVVLCSFTAGIHWGIHLSKRTKNSLYLISSGLTLLMWTSLLIVGTLYGVMLSAVVIFLLLLVEYGLSKERVTTPWFWVMRRGCSIIAISTLGIVIILVSSSTP